jgi:hypothetical protein
MAGERLREALGTYRRRYRDATKEERTALLDEFCTMTRYHRKYAIALLNRPDEGSARFVRRPRGPAYSPAALRVILAIWKAAGYPWSVRLKALVPLWLPWARRHLPGLTPEIQRQVLAISARQIDRRLALKKRHQKRRIYGRTKPGTLLRHQIPIMAEAWDVQEPGWTEVDLVSHSGPSASGEFGYSLNVTDVYLGWCESRAILGRGQDGVVEALDDVRRALPFPLRGIDSDNGSEFINDHLLRYCKAHGIAFTRGRPYKKDDNAHVEQKNWTHVRQIFGWARYDTAQAIAAMNELYRGELRLMMNLFLPSVKLLERVRVGRRLRRRYDAAKTPLDRLVEWHGKGPVPASVQALLAWRERTDPFGLAERIERKLVGIERLQAVGRAGVLASGRGLHRTAPLTGGAGRAAPCASAASRAAVWSAYASR